VRNKKRSDNTQFLFSIDFDKMVVVFRLELILATCEPATQKYDSHFKSQVEFIITFFKEHYKYILQSPFLYCQIIGTTSVSRKD
jgi:hypothetical protein